MLPPQQIAAFAARLVGAIGAALTERGKFFGYPDPVWNGAVNDPQAPYVLLDFPEDVQPAISWEIVRQLNVQIPSDWEPPCIQGWVCVRPLLDPTQQPWIWYQHLQFRVYANFAARSEPISGQPMGLFVRNYGCPRSVMVGFKLGGVPGVPMHFARSIADDVANADVDVRRMIASGGQ